MSVAGINNCRVKNALSSSIAAEVATTAKKQLVHGIGISILLLGLGAATVAAGSLGIGAHSTLFIGLGSGLLAAGAITSTRTTKQRLKDLAIIKCAKRVF